MSDVNPEVLEAMKARFGEEGVDDYLIMMKAVRYYIHSWGYYTETEDGSVDEAEARATIESMEADMRKNVDQTVGLVESLAAIVVHMVKGGTIEEWFENVGLQWKPEKSES